MNELYLIIGAAFIEISVPIICGYFIVINVYPSRFCTILGAIFPFVVMYLGVGLNQLLFGSDDTKWAYGAMWAMTFIPYAFFLVLGIALSVVTQNLGKLRSFFVGNSVPISIGAVFYVCSLIENVQM